ncbi:uncharacterized protein J3R85_021101 [Psidium guajava]|nr:uncharacterized protein J3R85_021101 [Psidium guajava]
MSRFSLPLPYFSSVLVPGWLHLTSESKGAKPTIADRCFMLM